jgi:hypothetical protein
MIYKGVMLSGVPNFAFTFGTHRNKRCLLLQMQMQMARNSKTSNARFNIAPAAAAAAAGYTNASWTLKADLTVLRNLYYS